MGQAPNRQGQRRPEDSTVDAFKTIKAQGQGGGNPIFNGHLRVHKDYWMESMALSGRQTPNGQRWYLDRHGQDQWESPLEFDWVDKGEPIRNQWG